MTGLLGNVIARCAAMRHGVLVGQHDEPKPNPDPNDDAQGNKAATAARPWRHEKK